MISTSQKEAIQNGQKQYFTSKPCKHGHIAARYTSNKACTDCLKKWNNSEAYKQYKTELHHKNAQAYIEKTRVWRIQNPHKHNSNNARRRANQVSATPAWANKEDITRFYEIAKWMSNLYGKSFQVDHIIPLQGKTVCGLHIETNLQILEAFANSSKSNKLIEELL